MIRAFITCFVNVEFPKALFAVFVNLLPYPEDPFDQNSDPFFKGNKTTMIFSFEIESLEIVVFSPLSAFLSKWVWETSFCSSVNGSECLSEWVWEISINHTIKLYGTHQDTNMQWFWRKKHIKIQHQKDSGKFWVNKCPFQTHLRKKAFGPSSKFA